MREAIASGVRRPYVVIQNDRANNSAIRTILVCPLTTNLRLGLAPGNIILEPNQSGLRERSVVNTSALASLDRSRFEEPIGRIPPSMVAQIVAGLVKLIDPEM